MSADGFLGDLQDLGRLGVGQANEIAQLYDFARRIRRERGDFHLQASVIMPSALNSRAVNHFVFTEQAARFAPLTAKTVQQTFRVAFFGSEATIFVADTSNAVPLAVSRRQDFAELTTSIEGLLDNQGFEPPRLHQSWHSN